MTDIRDGDAYSITIPDDAHPCIVFPAGLFDKTLCPKDAKPAAAAPGVNPDSRALALGSVQAGDAFATVVVTATQLADNAEPSDVREFAHGMADGLAKSRHGATLRGGAGRAEPHARRRSTWRASRSTSTASPIGASTT